MNARPPGLTNNRGPNRFPEAIPNIRRPERQRRNSNASTIKGNAIEIPNIYNSSNSRNTSYTKSRNHNKKRRTHRKKTQRRRR